MVSAPIDIQETEIPDVLEIRPRIFSDARGFFMETYNQAAWLSAGFPHDFVQDNLSLSHKGVLRGMHYQMAPHGMGKLIRVVSGAVFDVLVDLRRGSPTYGRWMGRELTEDQPLWLYAPVGTAHGFLSLCDDTRVYYKCTHVYAPVAERAIRYDDPTLNISWPDAPVQVSEKDASAPAFSEADNNFVYDRQP